MSDSHKDQLKKVLNTLGRGESNALERKLDWIGGFFKIILFLMIIGGLSYGIFLAQFSLTPLTPTQDPISYKSGIFNVTIQSLSDFEKGKRFLKNIDAIIANDESSDQTVIFPKNYTKIYAGKNGTDRFYTLKPDVQSDQVQRESFYIFKHINDQHSYRRDHIFLPPLSEGYSGRVVLERLLNHSFIDLVNFVAGYIVAKPLYRFKYSESITHTIAPMLRFKSGGLISSYSNQDYTTHKDQLSGYMIFYTGEDLIAALKSNRYFLVNEMVAPGGYFEYRLKENRFTGKILFKEAIFDVVIYKDGVQLKSIRDRNQFDETLEPGYYRVVIYKREPYFFGETPLLWVYLNFAISN